MKDPQPLFDSATYYHIEVRGRVDVDWLQDFDSSAQVTVVDAGQVEDVTVLNVHTDQSGAVGLVRRLHELGITILQFQLVSDGEEGAEVEENADGRRFQAPGI